MWVALFVVCGLAVFSACSVVSGQTWSGAAAGNDNWSDGENWVSGVAPANGGTVTLPSTVTPITTQFDQTGLRLGSLTLSSTAGAGWTIEGDDLLSIIQAGGGTTVFTSQGASINTIDTDLFFVNSDGTAATDRAAVVMGSGHRLNINGNVSGFGLRLSGGGEMAVNGDLTLTMADGGSGIGAGDFSLNLLNANTTFRFTGDTFTGNDAAFNMEGGTLIWDSDAPMSKFRIGSGPSGNGGHIVTAQNIAKRSGLDTGSDHFDINAGSGAAGFSALGGVRDINLENSAGDTLIWSSATFGANIIRVGVLELNTHAEANDQIRWTSNLNLRDNTSDEVDGKIIRVGNVSGVDTDAIFSGVIGDRNAGDQKNNIRTEGPGVLLLSGDNTNVGNWTVGSGTLLIGGTTSGQGNYVVGGGTIIGNAALGGTGTIGLASGKSVTVEGTDSFSATLAPGNSTGTLTVNGNVTIGDYGVLRITLDGSASGILAVNGNLDLSGTLNELELVGTPVQSYTLATYTGTLTGEFAVSTLPSGYELDYGSGLNSAITITAPPAGTVIMIQ